MNILTPLSRADKPIPSEAFFPSESPRLQKLRSSYLTLMRQSVSGATVGDFEGSIPGREGKYNELVATAQRYDPLKR